MKASFKVREDLTYWASDAGKFEPGEMHEVEGSDAVRLVAAAEAAGSLVEVQYDGQAEKVAQAAIESQEASEAVQAKAMEDGTWAEGNAMQAALDAEISEIEIGSES